MSTFRRASPCADNDGIVRDPKWRNGHRVTTSIVIPSKAGGTARLRGWRHEPYAFHVTEWPRARLASGWAETVAAPASPRGLSVVLAFGQVSDSASTEELTALLRGFLRIEPVSVRPHVWPRNDGRPARRSGVWFVTVAAADAQRCVSFNQRLLFGENVAYRFESKLACAAVLAARNEAFPGSRAPRAVWIAVAHVQRAFTQLRTTNGEAAAVAATES